MALIREAFPDSRRRGRALGVWAVGGAVAALVGQPLGGLLTTVDWRLVFTINLPVGVGMVLFLLTVAASPTRPPGPLRRPSFPAYGPAWQSRQPCCSSPQ
jgi:DHA2 family methylenomycin A resistance protein-like MFS transporter